MKEREITEKFVTGAEIGETNRIEGRGFWYKDDTLYYYSTPLAKRCLAISGNTIVQLNSLRGMQQTTAKRMKLIQKAVDAAKTAYCYLPTSAWH